MTVATELTVATETKARQASAARRGSQRGSHQKKHKRDGKMNANGVELTVKHVNVNVRTDKPHVNVTHVTQVNVKGQSRT